MRQKEFLLLLEEIIEADPNTLKGTETIDELPGWDSLAVVSFLSMVDEKTGITLAPRKIAESKTVQDLIALLNGKVV